MYRVLQSTQWISNIFGYYTIVRTIPGDEALCFLPVRWSANRAARLDGCRPETTWPMPLKL
jgi:hypothetical protein